MIELINLIKETFTYRNGNLFRNQTSRTQLNSRDIFNALCDRDPNFSYTMPQVNEAVRSAIDELAEEANANAQELTAPRFANEIEFVKAVLQSKGIDSNYRGDKFTQVLENGNKRNIELDQVYDYLEYDLGAYNRTTDRDNRFQVGIVKAALGVLLHETNNGMFARMQSELVYEIECEPYVEKTLKRILDVMKIKGDEEANIVVLKHFIWLVKRNLFSLETVNELWLALFGAQGCGKNYIAKNLLAGPLAEFYVETELNKLGDIDREIRKFTENLIVNFDELAMGTGDKSSKLNETMLQNLKTIVTRKELVFRQMGGQKQIKMDKKFVPMSTANHHLYDVIYDQTGMRRFYELNSEQEQGIQFDNAEVASIKQDMIKVYRGINEHNQKGFLDFGSEVGKRIQAIQSSYKPRTSIDEWIDDNGITKALNTEQAKTLYYRYKKYCTEFGYSPFGYKNFIVTMKDKFEEKQINHQLYFCCDFASCIPESPIKVKESVKVDTRDVWDDMEIEYEED